MPIIRNAQIEDLPTLADLIGQLGYDLSLSELSHNIKAYLHDRDRALFVAEIEGRVVGCCALDITRTFHRAQDQMRIVSLVVDEKHRNLGVGKALLKASENFAEKRNCWVIELTSSTRREESGVHDFYQSQGYLKNGEQAFFRKFISLK